MASLDEVITQIELREGSAAVTHDPLDGGGRTQFGISETANPEAWSDGQVTEQEARAIYMQKYVIHPGFATLPLLLQPLCIDWGVISGPQLVIMRLQKLLDVEVDGVLGPNTLAALPAFPEGLIRLTNKLVAERVRQVGKIVSKDPSQAKYVNGWLNRALEFLL
jgi:lysozyme family protein